MFLQLNCIFVNIIFGSCLQSVVAYVILIGIFSTLTFYVIIVLVVLKSTTFLFGFCPSALFIVLPCIHIVFLIIFLDLINWYVSLHYVWWCSTIKFLTICSQIWIARYHLKKKRTLNSLEANFYGIELEKGLSHSRTLLVYRSFRISPIHYRL